MRDGSFPAPCRGALGILGLALAAASLGLLAPERAAAQEAARLVTVTRVESPAMMAGMMGEGAQAPDTTVTWVKGLKRRIDSGPGSTIVDLADGTVITLDHDEKTWWRFDLTAMQAKVDSIMASMPQQMEVTGRVDVNPTGETMQIDGRAARRVVVTLSMDMQPSQDMSEGYNPMAAMGGMAMAVINEIWLSDEVPTARQAARAGEVDVEELIGGGMNMPFPGMDAVMDEMKDELARIGGEALLTRTYMTMLPGGPGVDAETILALNDQPLPDPDMSAMMGGGGGEPMIMSRTVSEVVAVETGVTIDDARFAPPADYAETEPPSIAELQERMGGGG